MCVCVFKGQVGGKDSVTPVSRAQRGVEERAAEGARRLAVSLREVCPGDAAVGARVEDDGVAGRIEAFSSDGRLVENEVSGPRPNVTAGHGRQGRDLHSDIEDKKDSLRLRASVCQASQRGCGVGSCDRRCSSRWSEWVCSSRVCGDGQCLCPRGRFSPGRRRPPAPPGPWRGPCQLRVSGCG